VPQTLNRLVVHPQSGTVEVFSPGHRTQTPSPTDAPSRAHTQALSAPSPRSQPASLGGTRRSKPAAVGRARRHRPCTAQVGWTACTAAKPQPR
jgi:hypothetical protein